MIQARPYHLMHYRLALKDWTINDWIVVSCEMIKKKKKKFQKVPAIKCDKFSVKSFSRHTVKCHIVYWVRSFHFDELDKVPMTPSSVYKFWFKKNVWEFAIYMMNTCTHCVSTRHYIMLIVIFIRQWIKSLLKTSRKCASALE